MKGGTAAVVVTGIVGLVVLVVTGHEGPAIVLGSLGLFALMVLS